MGLLYLYLHTIRVAFNEIRYREFGAMYVNSVVYFRRGLEGIKIYHLISIAVFCYSVMFV